MRGVSDCVKLHKEVLDKQGYVWFGKVGNASSIERIKERLGKEDFLLVLYCQGKVHVCKCVDITYEKTQFGYPKYYENVLFKTNRAPSLYFKLESIDELEKDVYMKCIASSSGRPLSVTVSKSMASFFTESIQKCFHQ
ncbi:hypothetical protein [Kandleria vitulina]|uniref:hypothetical protein n=1 Tax=Kandleria vitulina TaxID=1630 RepID=UPI0019D3EADC|nr:hypothetical protein [Kandleria vitulina]